MAWGKRGNFGVMKKLSLIVLVFCGLVAGRVCGQTDTTIRIHIPKCFFGGQILGQGGFGVDFEYCFIAKKHFAMSSNVGIGIADFGDDTYNPPTPGTRVIHTGIILLNFGSPSIKVVCSVHPSTYFHGKLTFVDLNGLFGVRYSHLGYPPWFIMISYTPKIYTSLTTTEYIYTHTNFGIRVGLFMDTLIKDNKK